MRGRAELCVDIKQIREIISVYKVLKLEQIYRVMKDKEIRIKKMIVSLLQRNEMMFVFDDICSSTNNWTKDIDRGIITAFWILLDFWDDVIFNDMASFPAKIEFMTQEDTFDIIVAEKGQENLINSFYIKRSDPTVRYLVVVDDTRQMKKIKFDGIAAFCAVDQNGCVKYYKGD